MIRSANVVRSAIVALLAQFLVIAPSGLDSHAAPASINYNNQVCELSTDGYLGTGSSGDPYQITDPESLWEVSDCSLTASAAAHFVLTQNIDVSTATTAPTNSPIGYTNSVAYSFSGVLDGNGFSIINNLMIADHGVGLFALLQNAIIKNLTIDGSFQTNTGGIEVTNSAGALAVQSIGSVTVQSVTNSADVTGFANVSGFIGYHSNSGNDYETLLTISSSVNLGTIYGNASPVGGFIGESSDTLHIYFSKNLGNVSGLGTDVGGFVGRISSNSTVISASSNMGSLDSDSTFAGGLVGRALSSLYIVNSFNTGSVNSCNYSGGLVASAQDLWIYDSYNEGTIFSGSCGPGSGTAGGIVAEVQQSLILERVFNSGNVQGEGDEVGGIIASAQTFTLSSAIDFFNSGTVSGGGAFGYKGGLFGTAGSNLRIERGYNSGRIQGSGIHDGVAGNGSPTVVSTYTTQASRFVATSTIPMLRSARAFTGWDFADTWGFGTCTENLGLPLLRFAEQRTTYFTEVCQGKLLLEFAAVYESTLSVQIPITNLAAGASLQILGQELEAIGDPIALSDNQVITLSGVSVSSEVIYFEISVSSPVFTLGAATNPESWTTSLKAIQAWGSLGPSTISNAIRGANVYHVPANLPDGVTTLDNFFSGQLNFNGDIGGWDTSNITSAANLFYNARSFNQDLSDWDVSSIQDFSGMFWGAEVFDQDISYWHVSAATNMANMFDRAHAFNHYIADWDVSNVTNMSLMFWNADSFNQPIGDWSTGNVVNMQEMFLGAESFNQDLSAWNVSNVTNMLGMFKEATIFDQNLSLWNVGNVTNMAGMFQGVWYAKTRFNNGGSPMIDQWSVSNVTDMSYMFSENSGFDQDLDGWDTSNVTNMRNMFYSSEFDGQIGAWDTSKVTNMRNMFTSTNFNQDISSWNTSNVTDMNSMFDNALFFDKPIGGWNVSKVSDMSSMFNNARSFNQPLGTWNVASVSSMNAMFYEAILFNQDLSGWSTSSVTDMYAMFRGATAFNSPLTNWDVTKVVRMDQMFLLASSFNQPLSSWQPSSVSNFASMFNGASSFNQDINSWNVSSATDMQAMFYNATSFSQDLDYWDTSNVEHMGSMFNAATSFNGDIDNWNVTSVSNASAMFQNATSFNRDIGDWDLREAVNLALMFEGATAFNQDISDWTVSAVTTFQGMFWGATSFNQDLANWDVSSGLYFPNMFRNASSFDQGLRWNLASASDMENFFSGSGLSCENYDTFLASASSTLPFLGVAGYQLGGGFYTPAALSDRSAITAKGWEISDSPCVTAPSLSGSNISKRTGEAISFTPANSGGAATFTISPSLPAGLSFSSANGAIAGQLSSVYSASHVITATNRSGTSSITITIEVALSSSTQDSSGSSTNLVTATHRLPLFDSLNKLPVPANTNSSVLITGTRLDLIRTVTMMGRALTVSAQSETSIRLEVPSFSPGFYNLNFALSAGSLEVSNALHLMEASSSTSSTNPLVLLVNKFSSWLSKEARAQIEAWVPPQSQVVCIAYNDRPGIAARKKAVSRAIQACRFVMTGVNTRIFVYGKAGSLANTVKLKSP